MNKRLWLAAVIWWIPYSIVVALSALHLGLGVAVILVSLRFILLGIPRVYDIWLSIFVRDKKVIAQLPKPAQRWPNRSWAISTLIWLVLIVVVFARFNIQLIGFFQ